MHNNLGFSPSFSWGWGKGESSQTLLSWTQRVREKNFETSNDSRYQDQNSRKKWLGLYKLTSKYLWYWRYQSLKKQSSTQYGLCHDCFSPPPVGSLSTGEIRFTCTSWGQRRAAPPPGDWRTSFDPDCGWRSWTGWTWTVNCLQSFYIMNNNHYTKIVRKVQITCTFVDSNIIWKRYFIILS